MHNSKAISVRIFGAALFIMWTIFEVNIHEEGTV